MSATAGESKVVVPQSKGGLLSRLWEDVVVFLLVHYIFWITWVIGALSLLGLALPPWAFYPLLALLALVYLPSFLDGSPTRLGRPWDAFRTHWLWQVAHRRSGVEVVRTSPLDPARNYIFACHPHGILILSRVLVYGGVWERLFPKIPFRVLGASPMFYLPACREMCLWMGGIDASRHSAEKALRSGLSLHIYPGGSKEIFETRPGTKETTIVLNDRKGFVKLAIRFGCPLVPVAVFGEKEAYHKLEINEGVRRWFLRNLKVPLLFFWGEWFTWMPLRRPMAVVFGAPIEVPKNPHPTDEEVDKYHALYVERFKALFEEHKKNYPFARDQELIIK